MSVVIEARRPYVTHLVEIEIGNAPIQIDRERKRPTKFQPDLIQVTWRFDSHDQEWVRQGYQISGCILSERLNKVVKSRTGYGSMSRNSVPTWAMQIINDSRPTYVPGGF